MVLCFGVVTTALSLGYRLRNALMMRAHVLELGQEVRAARLSLGQEGQAAKFSKARRQAQQHEYELVQVQRTKVVASLVLLSVVAQGNDNGK